MHSLNIVVVHEVFPLPHSAMRPPPFDMGKRLSALRGVGAFSSYRGGLLGLLLPVLSPLPLSGWVVGVDTSLLVECGACFEMGVLPLLVPCCLQTLSQMAWSSRWVLCTRLVHRLSQARVWCLSATLRLCRLCPPYGGRLRGGRKLGAFSITFSFSVFTPPCSGPWMR